MGDGTVPLIRLLLVLEPATDLSDHWKAKELMNRIK